MAFVKKTWKDRLVEYAGRRTLKRISGSPESQMVVDVTRNEGTVSQAGDAFSAANMNDLEQRILDGFTEVNNDLVSDIYVGDDGRLHKTKGGADTVLNFSPFSGDVIASGSVNSYGSSYTWTSDKDYPFLLLAAASYNGNANITSANGNGILNIAYVTVYSGYSYLNISIAKNVVKGQTFTFTRDNFASYAILK